jgi:hypothetical protein
MALHPELRKTLDVPVDVSDEDVLRFWKKRWKRYCKPCWELKYCPYGPLVEDFPLLPPTLEAAEAHQSYLKGCLESGRLPDGSDLTPERRKMFESDVASFDAENYPDEIPPAIAEARCRVFGHLCPVFFAAEPLTETKDLRSEGRSIPREVMLKVVRRDGQICQRCFQPVPDDQVEFDHVIPFSKGGATTADNLKLCCRSCNRKKSDSLQDILSPNPIEHLFTLRKRGKA